MTIGERMKQRRKELGISIHELSKSLGKNRATIYRYENNEIESIPMTILKPLSEILQTTPEYLCGIQVQAQQLELDIFAEQKKASFNQEENLFEIQNEDIRQLVAASKQMTDEQMRLVRKYAQFMFPETFS